MKVRITKSNCTFVRPGDITEIVTRAGRNYMWSSHLCKYEEMNWVTHLWGVEYETLTEQESK